MNKKNKNILLGGRKLYILVFFILSVSCSPRNDRKSPLFYDNSALLINKPSTKKQTHDDKNKNESGVKDENGGASEFSLSQNASGHKIKKDDFNIFLSQSTQPRDLLIPSTLSDDADFSLGQSQKNRNRDSSRFTKLVGDIEELIEITDAEVSEILNASRTYPDEEFMPPLTDKYMMEVQIVSRIKKEVQKLTKKDEEIFKELEIIDEDGPGEVTDRYKDAALGKLSNDFVATGAIDGIFKFVNSDLNVDNSWTLNKKDDETGAVSNLKARSIEAGDDFNYDQCKVQMKVFKERYNTNKIKIKQEVVSENSSGTTSVDPPHQSNVDNKPKITLEKKDLPKLKRVPIYDLEDGLIDAKIVNELYEDKFQRVWLASRTAGLFVRFKYSPSNRFWRVYDNYPASSIIYNDKEKVFYVGSRVQAKEIKKPEKDDDSAEATYLRTVLDLEDENVVYNVREGYQGFKKLFVPEELTECDFIKGQDHIDTLLREELVQGFKLNVNQLKMFSDKLMIATQENSLWFYNECPSERYCTMKKQGTYDGDILGQWGIWKGFPGIETNDLLPVNDELMVVTFSKLGTYYLRKGNTELIPLFSDGNFGLGIAALEYDGDIVVASEKYLLIYEPSHFKEKPEIHKYHDESESETAIREYCEKQEHPQILAVNKQHLGVKISDSIKDVRLILDGKFLAISSASSVFVTNLENYRKLKKTLHDDQYEILKKKKTQECINYEEAQRKFKEEQSSKPSGGESSTF